MGCDIHLYVEINTEVNNYKSWKIFEKLYRIGLYDKEEILHEKWYGNRNYNVFAMLADVRNYHDIEPISFRKGIPENTSEKIKMLYDSWAGDSHSASYFTLYQLLELEKQGYWNKTITHTGKVLIEEFDDYWKDLIIEKTGNKLVLKKSPDSFAQDIYSPSNQNKIFDIEFKETYKESAESFINFIEELKKLFTEYDFYRLFKQDVKSSYEERMDYIYKNVRIVFWFDN